MAGFGFIYSFYMLVLVIDVWLLFRPAIVERAHSTPGPWKNVYRVLALGVLEITPRAAEIDRKLVHALSVIGIPAACILHGYVGFLFGAIKANPWWSTSLMPVIFLTSAIVSGISLLVLLYLFLCRRSGFAVDDACMKALAQLLWRFLVLAVTFEAIDLLHVAYESEEEWHVIRELLVTKLRFSYFTLQVLIGSVVPLLLLPIPAFTRWFDAPFRHSCTAVAAVLALVQVLAMRWNVVVGGQLFSKSFRGFVDYPVTWFGREGLLGAAPATVLETKPGAGASNAHACAAGSPPHSATRAGAREVPSAAGASSGSCRKVCETSWLIATASGLPHVARTKGSSAERLPNPGPRSRPA
jgi:Ni/Fe-hydrogenase subunit HybB-like protein